MIDMNTNNNFFLTAVCALAFAFCLSSCEDFFETQIDIDPPEVVPKLVVNTFINLEQDSVGFFIRTNEPLGSETSTSLTNIEAEITIENVSDNVTITADKNTQSPIPYNYLNSNINTDFLNADDEYLFTVRDLSGDYPTASAQVRFPSKSTIKNIEYKYEGGIREDGDEASSFKITFDDPVDEKNFYEIGIIRDYDPNRPSSYDFASSIDIAASKGFINDFVLLTDESFNGEEKTIELKTFRNSVDNIPFHIGWRNVTEDYFKYSKTLRAQGDFGDNPFSSIVQVFTNVENGLGIVSLYQEQILPAN
jgi:hypothetical protein